jgi:hypothetical protein
MMLLLATIPIVWTIDISLHVYHRDWLGWFYAKLLPATDGLYWLVEIYFPGDVNYRVQGAISEDFGQ